MVAPLLFASSPLLYFAPFMILAFYRTPFNHALWWAFACGCVVDLFSSQTPLGTYALNYCCTTFLLYKTKDHFFEDRLSTLPVMTLLFSTLSNSLQGILLYAFGKAFHLSLEWVQEELILTPLKTALFAIFAFTLPVIAVQRLRRRPA